MGFRVMGLVFEVWDSGRRVRSLGFLAFRIQGSGFRVQGLEFRVWGLGFRVTTDAFRFQGLGFRVRAQGSEK